MMTEKVKKYIKIVGFQASAFSIYILFVRPLRAKFTEWIRLSEMFDMGGLPDYITHIYSEKLSLSVFYVHQNTDLVFSYGPQFGFFFLIAVMGMAFFLPPASVFVFLIGFHAIIEVLVLTGIYLGLNGIVYGFIGADFFITYFSPMISLSFIVYIFMHKKITQ